MYAGAGRCVIRYAACVVPMCVLRTRVCPWQAVLSSPRTDNCNGGGGGIVLSCPVSSCMHYYKTASAFPVVRAPFYLSL